MRLRAANDKARTSGSIQHLRSQASMENRATRLERGTHRPGIRFLIVLLRFSREICVSPTHHADFSDEASSKAIFSQTDAEKWIEKWPPAMKVWKNVLRTQPVKYIKMLATHRRAAAHGAESATRRISLWVPTLTIPQPESTLYVHHVLSRLC
jgi:hypothetical protein